MTMKLTEKQIMFAHEYLIDLNATQAAIRAGYSKRSARQRGHVLLDNPQVQAIIKDRLAEAEDALVAKGDEVLKYLTAVMRGEEEVVKMAVSDGIFIESEAYIEQKNQIKAAELLAKCHGLMIQRVDVGDVQLTFVDDLPPDNQAVNDG